MKSVRMMKMEKAKESEDFSDAENNMFDLFERRKKLSTRNIETKVLSG